MEQVSGKPIILYAEDDFDDFESLKEALDQLTDQQLLLHAKNGEEAVQIVQTAAVPPSLIVLDLNMPVMEGCGFPCFRGSHFLLDLFHVK